MNQQDQQFDGVEQTEMSAAVAEGRRLAIEMYFSTITNIQEVLTRYNYFLGTLADSNDKDPVEATTDIIPIIQTLKTLYFLPSDYPYENIKAGDLKVALRLFVEAGLKFYFSNYYTRDDRVASIIKRFQELIESFSNNLGQSIRPRGNMIRKFTSKATHHLMEQAILSLESKVGSSSTPDDIDLLDHSVTLYNTIQARLSEHMFRSFETGILDSRSLYTKPDLWMDVTAHADYTPMVTGKKLLENNLPEIIRLTCGDSKKVKIFDWGMGAGEKTQKIMEAFVNEGKKVTYHGVDSSHFMLQEGTIGPMKRILKIIIDIAKKYNKQQLNLPDCEDENPVKKEKGWQHLLNFIQENDLKLSANDNLDVKLARIFIKFTDPKFRERYREQKKKEPELAKHLFARMLSLHIGSPKGKDLIKKLETEIEFPLVFIPRPVQIESLGCDDYKTDDDENIIAFDLGCRICNKHPIASMNQYRKFLSRAETMQTDESADGPSEKEIKAPYLITGMQLSHFDNDHPRYKEEKESILKGYLTPASEAFILHPFTQEFISYHDDELNKSFSFYELREDKNEDGTPKEPYCSFITDYEDDPNNAGWHRIVHKLRFNRDITVLIGNKRKEIKKGFEILLMASYKPTLEQMIELFTREGLNVCEVYKDDEGCPKYVKFLLRKKTDSEAAIADDVRINQLIKKFCRHKSSDQLKAINSQPTQEIDSVYGLEVQ